MQKFILFPKKTCLLLCFIGATYCQKLTSVNGKIIDDVNQKPIHGANIYVEKFNLGISSDVDGSFIIENLPLDEVLLKISMIGYKDINKTIKLSQKPNDIGAVFMEIDAVKIEEIVVDSHLELKPKSLSSNIDIIGNKYHSNLKSSLALTIRDETGLSIRSMGQGSTQPVLRGYSGDRFLLTEDGVTAGDLSNTSIDHTVSMDMATYNKIRVIRGPEALLYGSNTIGGVIDVSRQIDSGARFKKVSVQSIIGAESSNSSLFGHVTCYLPINYKNQFKFSILNRNTSDERSPNETIENSALTNNELTGSYSYYGKDFRSTISYETLDMEYGIPGSPEGHIDGVDINLNKNTQRFNFHKEISLMGFQTLDFDQRFIMYDHSETEKGNSSPSVILEQKVFSVQSTIRRPSFHLGSLLQYRDFIARGFYWTPDTEEINLALFGLVEKKINKLVLQFSTRVEHLSVIPNITYGLSNIETNQVRERNFTLASAGFSAFRNWNQWQLSIASLYTGRAPGIEDLYSDGPHLGVYSYEIGNPNINLENTAGIEIGLNYKNKNNRLSFSGYQNYSPNFHISTKMGNCDQEFNPKESHPCAGADFIEWGSGSSGWLYKYEIKELRSLIQGFESDFLFGATDRINFYGSLSIVRGTNLSQNEPLAYMPPDKFLFSTEINLESFSTSFTIKRVSKQNRLSQFETKTEGYLIAGLNATYNIKASNFLNKIVFQVDNIFNQEYYNHLSRLKSIMPEKGRSFGIQYRMIF